MGTRDVLITEFATENVCFISFVYPENNNINILHLTVFEHVRKNDVSPLTF